MLVRRGPIAIHNPSSVQLTLAYSLLRADLRAVLHSMQRKVNLWYLPVTLVLHSANGIINVLVLVDRGGVHGEESGCCLAAARCDGEGALSCPVPRVYQRRLSVRISWLFCVVCSAPAAPDGSSVESRTLGDVAIVAAGGRAVSALSSGFQL